MIVTQQDIGKLDDGLVKVLVLEISRVYAPAADEGPQASLMRSFAAALIAALLERKRTMQVMEVDLLNADITHGKLVGPDDDPIEDARRQLRERPM